jgi:uncharacterized membrane protein YqaE (UPF0057 family)
MYELFAFTNDLNPILQGILSGLVAFLAVFLFRGFYFWLTGVNLLLGELRELNTNLKDIKELQAKDYEIQRRIYSLSEVNKNSLQNIDNNIEQLVFIWE